VSVRLLAAAAIVAAHATGCASPPRQPVFDDVRVTSRGQDEGGEFCADFALTPAQARTFFARAAAVTPMILHDRYELLPCWVRGTARDAAGEWRWEVRAGGTARLEAPSGEVTLLACDRCDELFGGKKTDKPSH
jgi:hypothetical protein